MPFMHLKSDVGYIFATAIVYERDATSYYNSLHYNEVQGQINLEDAFFENSIFNLVLHILYQRNCKLM